MTGRPEHVDKVTHSGTWHVQLSGTKTWFIRPCADAADWRGRAPSLENLEQCPLALRTGVGRASTRLRVEVAAGDMLLINTRAWWHRTELDAQPALSVSYARDFVLEQSSAEHGRGGAVAEMASPEAAAEAMVAAGS